MSSEWLENLQQASRDLAELRSWAFDLTIALDRVGNETLSQEVQAMGVAITKVEKKVKDGADGALGEMIRSSRESTYNMFNTVFSVLGDKDDPDE